MEAAKNRRRLILLTSIVTLCFVGLGCRLVNLHWTQHDEFARLAEEQHDHVYYREAPRGSTFGPPRAAPSPRVFRSNVCALTLPHCAGMKLEIARFLAPLLQTNESVLASMLFAARISQGPEASSPPDTSSCKSEASYRRLGNNSILH